MNIILSTTMEITFKKNKRNRVQKGKSLIELPSDYCLLDIETTGLDARFDDAIEIAIIKVRDNVIIDRFHSYIYTDIKISNFINELTGITQEDIINAPKPKVVWIAVKNFIQNDILIAHNANFDINFIYDEMEENNILPITNNFVDTLRLSRITFPIFKNHKLKTLLNELKIKSDKLHRALNDVIATFEVYKNIQNNLDLEDYYVNKRKRITIKVSDINANKCIENDYISNNVFVFTGKLEYYTRKEAMQEVVNNGGRLTTCVTKKTNYLVMGTYDYYSGIKNEKSSKHKKAEQYKENGQEIEIIPETVFYDMLNKN